MEDRSAIITASNDVIETTLDFSACSAGHGPRMLMPVALSVNATTFASQPSWLEASNFVRDEMNLAAAENRRIEGLTLGCSSYRPKVTIDQRVYVWSVIKQ